MDIPFWVVERCANCAYLVEHEDGSWGCDDYETNCEDVLSCILDEDEEEQ